MQVSPYCPPLPPPLYRIPDSIATDIQRKCQSIFPLQEVHIRKVKVLKKPKFDGERRERERERERLYLLPLPQLVS